jgi:hypothetical protein
MVNDKFKELPIADLLETKQHFVIPSFQRGYRWETKQVEDLLNDILQFSKGSGNKYILQPIVVQPTTFETNGIVNDAWLVLDGQQRLTTLLLILKYCFEDLTQAEKRIFSDCLYEIHYTNRFELDFENPQPVKDIDSFYLSNAKATIIKWFQEKAAKRINTSVIKSCLFYKDAQKKVEFIWYVSETGNTEDHQSDLAGITVFNNLNKGKISLTSSELIKALLIIQNKQNNPNNADNQITKFAMEWDMMEKKFQDDKFWYFISGDTQCQTRIDVLFDFVTNKPCDADSDYSYRVFQGLFDQNEDLLEKWKEVKSIYDRMVSWFEDDMLYHYIGYLVAIGFSPLEIHNKLEEMKEKAKALWDTKGERRHWTTTDTQTVLRGMIREKFKVTHGNSDDYKTIEDIDAFEYKNQDFVRRLLLLFNIETCYKSQILRFDFDSFKNEHWDIEHIDSRNRSSLQTKEDRMRWMNGVKFILSIESKSSSGRQQRAIELLAECKGLIDKWEPEGKEVEIKKYASFYERINKYFSSDNPESEVNLESMNKDNINNLTLLNSKTNREYKDAPFPYKRYCIIRDDKGGERFTPICTRNVFLKYYTEQDTSVSQLDSMRWNQGDKDDYIKAIHAVVDPIFNTPTLNEQYNG